ncbi:MAG: ABC transporter ATP-binding protein [Candidatus Bathyarchaeota archaeon]
MVGILLKNLSKHFGGVKAVDNINLEIKEGEFLSLLGPSGCGKTTTLRLTAGLETPTSGEIYFDDRPISKVSPAKRNVAMVFQSYAIYPHMTVLENIAFPLEARGVPKKERMRRAKEAAEFVKIEELLNRKPAQLSGGQRQRVALARAIVRHPSVYLLDEPLSNLDAKLRVLMRAELKRMHEKLKVTTVYVTHDQVEAMTMSDRVAVMKEGALQQVGTADELYSRPMNKWVAGFIGSPPMNLIDCALVEKNGGKFLDAGEFTIPLNEGSADSVVRNATSSNLTFGVRPEHLSVHKEKKSDSIEGELYALEPLGECIIVDAVVGGNLIKAKIPPGFAAATGSKVYLTFDEKAMYIYDREKLLTWGYPNP